MFSHHVLHSCLAITLISVRVTSTTKSTKSTKSKSKKSAQRDSFQKQKIQLVLVSYLVATRPCTSHVIPTLILTVLLAFPSEEFGAIGLFVNLCRPLLQRRRKPHHQRTYARSADGTAGSGSASAKGVESGTQSLRSTYPRRRKTQQPSQAHAPRMPP